MLIIDFLFIIGFIVYLVLKSLGESNQRKRETVRRTIKSPGSPGMPTRPFNPEPVDDRFPGQTLFPWEEDVEQNNSQWEELSLDEDTPERNSQEGYGLESDSLGDGSLKGYSLEERVEPEGFPLPARANLASFAEPQVSMQVTTTKDIPNFALQLTSEQIWQGVLWSQILMPPKCKGGGR